MSLLKLRIFQIFVTIFNPLVTVFAQDTIFQKSTDYTITIIKEKIPEIPSQGYFLHNYEGLPIVHYNQILNREREDSVICTSHAKVRKKDTYNDIYINHDNCWLEHVSLTGDGKNLIFYGDGFECHSCPNVYLELYSTQTGNLIKARSYISDNLGFKITSTRQGSIYYTANKGKEINLVKLDNVGAESFSTRIGGQYINVVNGNADIDYINIISVSNSEKYIALVGKQFRIYNDKGEFIGTVAPFYGGTRALKFIGDDFLFLSQENYWQLFDVKNNFKEIRVGKVDIGKIYGNSSVLVFPKRNLVINFTKCTSDLDTNTWLLQIIDIATGKSTVESIVLDYEGKLNFGKTANISDTKGRYYSDKFSLLVEVK